jgi:hypothetical protein
MMRPMSLHLTTTSGITLPLFHFCVWHDVGLRSDVREAGQLIEKEKALIIPSGEWRKAFLGHSSRKLTFTCVWLGGPTH